jgi:hypothetical protein
MKNKIGTVYKGPFHFANTKGIALTGITWPQGAGTENLPSDFYTGKNPMQNLILNKRTG